MKTILAKTNTQVGAELRIIDESGNITTLEVAITKDGICYELPTNPANRKWVNIKRFQAMEATELELQYKENRTLNVTGEKAPRKADEDYLEGEERELFLKLKAKAKANREAANKKTPMTELEKKQRQVERLMARIKELEGAEA